MDTSGHDDTGTDREARAALRRVVLAAGGPPLADMDAAVECICACHPRPAEVGLHQGGADCPCQRSAEENAARFADVLARLHDSADEGREERDAADAVLDTRARELGVDAHVASETIPFVVSGHCDGHAFYLREREGWYEVLVSDEPSDADLWRARDVASHVVAEGSDTGLWGADGEVYALDLAVREVRRDLGARACDHAARGEWPYCPQCGTRADH